jgi:hypothetical protein
MNEEQLTQLSQAELLKLFIEKSHQVQDLQNRLTIAEAQLSSLGLIQDYIVHAHSPQWEEAVRQKLEQLAKVQADLQTLLNGAAEPEEPFTEESDADAEESTEEQADEPKDPEE